jgi:hypothetical protein
LRSKRHGHNYDAAMMNGSEKRAAMHKVVAMHEVPPMHEMTAVDEVRPMHNVVPDMSPAQSSRGFRGREGYIGHAEKNSQTE